MKISPISFAPKAQTFKATQYSTWGDNYAFPIEEEKKPQQRVEWSTWGDNYAYPVVVKEQEPKVIERKAEAPTQQKVEMCNWGGGYIYPVIVAQPIIIDEESPEKLFSAEYFL